jgi:hypothetical protein
MEWCSCVPNLAFFVSKTMFSNPITRIIEGILKISGNLITIKRAEEQFSSRDSLSIVCG